MRVRSLMLCAAVAIALLSPAVAQEPAPKPAAELKVLERLEGTWDQEMVIKPGVWVPNGVTTAGTAKYTWVLDGRYLEGRGKDSDQSEHIWMYTYDPQLSAYRTWWFGTQGQAETRGEWNEATRTLSLKGKPATDEFSWVESWTFPSADQAEWQGTWKDKDGKIVMEVHMTNKRRR